MSRFALSLPLVLVSLWTPTVLIGQNGTSANDLLRTVLENEIRAQTADHSHWRYQSISPASGINCKRKEVIETKDGQIAHLLTIGGRPLTADEEKNEEHLIQTLVNSPEEQQKKLREAQEEGKKAEQFLRKLPDQVIASYGARKGDLLQLNYKPNPKFSPSSREEQVFHVVEGEIWVNTKENRLARFEGRLTNSVKFGGGLLGYLEQGGTFQIQQSEVAPGHWEVTLMHVDVKGKALCFKTINVHQDEARIDFQPIPETFTLQQAAAELRRQVHDPSAPGIAASAANQPESTKLQPAVLIGTRR